MCICVFTKLATNFQPDLCHMFSAHWLTCGATSETQCSVATTHPSRQWSSFPAISHVKWQGAKHGFANCISGHAMTRFLHLYILLSISRLTWDLDSAFFKSVVETSSLSHQAFASIRGAIILGPDKLEPRNTVAKDNSCVRLEQVQQDKMLAIVGSPPHTNVHSQSVAWNLFDWLASTVKLYILGSPFRPKVCTRPLRTFWNACVRVSHVTCNSP